MLGFCHASDLAGSGVQAWCWVHSVVERAVRVMLILQLHGPGKQTEGAG